MPEEMLTDESIKNILQNAVQNQEHCGFAAYIICKSEPKLREMILDEGKFNSGDNYKQNVRNVMLGVISEKYLDEDVEYVSGNKVADDQRKLYIINQDEKYKPFDYLTNDLSDVPDFKSDDIDDAIGIAFWFRIDDQEFWAYQHLWSIMVPNKKKNNLLSRIQRYENHDYFLKQKEPLITIASKIDLLIISDCIITSNISLLQNSFGFKDFIIATANKSIDRVTQKQLVYNPDKLREYIDRGKTSKYAKKMMRISNSRVLELSNEKLMEKVHSLARWKDKFEENEDGLIVLNTFSQVESLIDLLDERFTRSDVTDQEYDTDVKQIAEPIVVGGNSQ